MHDDRTRHHCGRPSAGRDGRCEDRREAERLRQEVRRLRAECERLEREVERDTRRIAGIERDIQRTFLRAVRDRGLWRLPPGALAAELNQIRLRFIAEGMDPGTALARCGELEALARGHAAAVRAGGGGRR